VRSNPRLFNALRLSAVVLVLGGVLLASAPPAFASTTTFIPGDLVVYETQGTSSAAQAVDLVGYTTSGSLDGYSVALPTMPSGTNNPLVESGAALNDGELTLSADGLSLVATGYDSTVGTLSITSAASTPRTVALVSSTGTVDTSTALADGTTEGQNFRSATTAVTGGNIYNGGGAGIGYTADGATANTLLDTTDKVHEVLVSNGQLYESTTKNIFAVGSGLPTSGTPTTTALLSGANLPANFGPDEFAFVRLESGSGPPDTMYVADGSNGATAGDPNLVEKYSLEGTTWTATGSVTVPLVAGLAATVSNGVASIYVTGATSTSNSNNTVMDSISDSSGYKGTLTGATVTTIATTSTGDFKGLVILPASSTPVLPEAPYAILLPVLGVLVGGVYLALRRRHAAA
jgi:hypothetical protein